MDAGRAGWLKVCVIAPGVGTAPALAGSHQCRRRTPARRNGSVGATDDRPLDATAAVVMGPIS
jgi:hypothetical protein